MFYCPIVEIIGYTLEQPQAVGIVGIVGISLLTKGPAMESCMGLVMIFEAHDVFSKFCIL